MDGAENGLNLAREPDFTIGPLKVSPSACRIVAGDQEQRTEAKTMAVLVTLARAAGATVTRDDLINACWEGRIVSDDAVTRAIAKVRALARLTEPEAFALETVPKVGYRLKAEVSMTTSAPTAEQAAALAPVVEQVAAVAPAQEQTASFAPAAEAAAKAPAPSALPQVGQKHIARIVGYVAAAVLVVVATYFISFSGRPTIAAPPPVVASITQQPPSAAVAEAVHNLDIARLREFLASGWKPAYNLNSERNTALHVLGEVCERNRTHDQKALVEIAQLLIAAGADPSAENKWGDTPYSIARCPWACGPDHPIVAYLESVTPHPKVMPCRAAEPGK